MDRVYQYKEELSLYILNCKDSSQKITISFNDFLYIILSSNPKNDIHLKNIIKKIIPCFKNDKVLCSLLSLSSLIDYINISGLDEDINKNIYDYLFLDQIINQKISQGDSINDLTPIIKQHQDDKIKIINILIQ